MVYATDILFLLSLWTGKLSVSFLFHRLAADSNKSLLGWGLTGLVSIFGVVSIFIVALRADISEPWYVNLARAWTILRLPIQHPLHNKVRGISCCT